MVDRTDPNAPSEIDIKIHIYEDEYGRRHFHDTTRWPNVTCKVRYLGRYDGKIIKSSFPDPEPENKKRPYNYSKIENDIIDDLVDSVLKPETDR